tara:strand:- start:139 stop:324 length:186 start_codon:yes stop_codon:yes gene_type:complete
MDLVIALGIPLVIILGLTIIFTTDGVPNWVYHINNKYSRKTWLYGVIALSIGSLIIAMFSR